MRAGTLYVVATPLGNLGDLSPRAAEVLRSVAVVAAEDTRRSRGLLTHLDAAPRLLSFHAHSGERRAEQLVALLAEGQDVALVTDAGTPAISDPGAELVAAARAAGHAVVPVPGPSAVATALSAAGLGGDRYLFLGFLPRKGSERARLLQRAAREEWPVVCFEAANRLVELLEELAALAGPDRAAVVARELTKLHEELRAGTLASLAGHYAATEPRGEVTLVLAGSGAPEAPPDRTEEARDAARRWLAEGASRKDVAQRVAEAFGVPRNDAYRLVQELA
ncbi:MAG: 16S rRNA (cytidine(1402)-2'-O)-methyltransferase [Gemmatimonadales bacterium]|nr:16S rRNA (cytidine(1402)-2'-O)-methyltransferase [Gemmatimonadales bacterium]